MKEFDVLRIGGLPFGYGWIKEAFDYLCIANKDQQSYPVVKHGLLKDPPWIHPATFETPEGPAMTKPGVFSGRLKDLE